MDSSSSKIASKPKLASSSCLNMYILLRFRKTKINDLEKIDILYLFYHISKLIYKNKIITTIILKFRKFQFFLIDRTISIFYINTYFNQKTNSTNSRSFNCILKNKMTFGQRLFAINEPFTANSMEMNMNELIQVSIWK